MKPGVLTGKDYLDFVQNAKTKGFAVPAVNITSTSTLNAALEAAQSAKADIIIQLSGGGAQYYAGVGIKDTLAAQISGGVSAALHVHEVAQHYGVGVVLHTDHANRGLLPWVDGLISRSEAQFASTGKPLFSSHMIDLSEEPIEDNLAACAERLARLAKIDMSLEIELGVTGGEEDGVGKDLDEIDNDKLYTQPEEVMEAYRALSPLGHFSIAAAFGNVHGVYSPGAVQLRPEILLNSQKLGAEKLSLGDQPFDFVFHGGSGSDPADIKAAISYGVFKVNIDTDTQFAYSKPVGDYVQANATAFKHQIDPDTAAPYKKQYDPRKWMRAGEVSMRDRLIESFDLLGATGQSVCV